ncbi:MAG: hypothetical protein KC933_15200 [Myxococcales bacterium]|nr:hypothetical protein [Myxococcales bacterium]
MSPRTNVKGIPALLLAGAWAGLAAGCLAEIGDPDATPQLKVDSGVEPDAGFLPEDAGTSDAGAGPVLVEDLNTLPTSTRCVDLGRGEVPLAVSPEGHLWLGTSTTGATLVRVLDGWDAAAEQHYRFQVGAMTRVQAWTSTAASFIADGKLYHAVDGLRTEVTVTATLSADATLCGDPTEKAFVYSGGTLYQRDGDAWYVWEGIDDALSPDARILSRDGACFGADDGVWFASADLELWQLGSNELRRPAHRDGASQPVLLHDTPMVLAGGNLLVGPMPWTEYTFEHGAATAMASAGDYVWIQAGDRVLRFDGTTFMLVRGSAGALFPHASGGLWVTGGGQACHFAPQAMLRVEGVSTGAQQIGDTFSLEVRASDEAATVDVALDGAPLTARRVADGWFVYGGALELGWHRLAVTTPAAQVSRTVLIKRLPAVERSFATDIAPIYTTHCAGCHYDGNTFGAPDLATVEQWRNLADKIHRRVVEAKNMPPVASRLPEWGEDEVTVINEWLSGGLLP